MELIVRYLYHKLVLLISNCFTFDSTPRLEYNIKRMNFIIEKEYGNLVSKEVSTGESGACAVAHGSMPVRRESEHNRRHHTTESNDSSSVQSDATSRLEKEFIRVSDNPSRDIW